MNAKTFGISFGLAFAAFFLCSCSEDETTPAAPVEQGQIIVEPQPDTISPTWTLAGPNGFSHSAQGPITLVDLDVGEYSLSWGDYLNWTTPTPNPQVVQLPAHLEITIQGTYTPPIPGTVDITILPQELNAEWVLTGPNTYSRSGTGDSVIPDVPAGNYSISWTSYINYESPNPNPMPVEVLPGETTTVQAVYEYEPAYPFPGSPDVLMESFQTIYETRDFDEYRKIIHPDFLTILQDETIQDFPDLGETLDVNEDLRIHQRMFSGDAVVDPDGDLVGGVANISFSRFIALDTWAISPPTDIIPNAEWALYDVEFLFDRGQTFSTLKVEGAIKFYLTHRDSMHEGSLRQYYQMLGQVDLTQDSLKAVELALWGSVKAIFR